MIMDYVPMFMAFVTGWMMVCMTLGHVGMGQVLARLLGRARRLALPVVFAYLLNL